MMRIVVLEKIVPKKGEVSGKHSGELRRGSKLVVIIGTIVK